MRSTRIAYSATTSNVATTAAAGYVTAAVQDVRGVTVKIDRPMKTDRYYPNNQVSGVAVKSEPPQNARSVITGTINADYITKGDFADRFSADTPFALVWTLPGPNIASTFFETFTVALPQCYLETDTPTLAGYDEVNVGFNSTALYDGTNAPISILYMSKDTAI